MSNEVYQFRHDEKIKPSCCLTRTRTTYVLADSRETAEELGNPDIGELTGLCAPCMAELLAEENYKIERIEE